MAHVHPFSIAGRWRCSFLPEATVISMSIARNKQWGNQKTCCRCGKIGPEMMEMEAMEAMALIEIDGLYLLKKMVIFHGYVTMLNKMVDIQIYPVYPTSTNFYSTLRLIKTLRGSVL